MSERDGWNHLYLYDGVTGQGEEADHEGRVGRARRRPRGHDDAADLVPRERHVRGQGPVLRPLLPHQLRRHGADAAHRRRRQPRGQLLAGPAVLRRHLLARRPAAGDASCAARATASWCWSWRRPTRARCSRRAGRPPEVFVAKGRDGKTDIYGVIIRPTNFDPTKKYPVIENIYAGPQGSFVPKTFGVAARHAGAWPSSGSSSCRSTAWARRTARRRSTTSLEEPRRRRLPRPHPLAQGGRGEVPVLRRHAASASTARRPAGRTRWARCSFTPSSTRSRCRAAGCHDNRMDKIWWNEQWMGWPVGPQYAASSNVDNADKLQGKLLLIVGEMDTNVDPASTMQVVNALIKADKTSTCSSSRARATRSGGAYGERRRNDFFVAPPARRRAAGAATRTWRRRRRMAPARKSLSVSASGFAASYRTAC